MSVPLGVPGFNAGQPLLDIDAGLPMIPLYDAAGQVFPILKAAEPIQILPDTPAGSWGLAWYRGLVAGHPTFAVRDDVSLNAKIAYHEAGHAFEELLGPLRQTEIRDRYWAFRGFPQTWDSAYVTANAQPGVGAAWPYLPGESWAEAFSAAVSGTVLSEWTVTYGKDLALTWWQPPGNGYDPAGGALRARAFFLELMRPLLGGDELTPEEHAWLKRIYDHLEAEEPKVWNARDQRGLDVETGQTFDPAKPPLDPRIKP